MFWNKVKKRRYGIALFGALLVLCVFAFVFSSCEKIEAEDLSAPTNIKIEDEKMTWSAVQNASGYMVEIDGKTYETESNSLDVFTLFCMPKTYKIRVMAVGDWKYYIDSEWSEETEYTLAPSLGISLIAINDGSEYQVIVEDASAVGKKLVIPDSYNGIPITKIAHGAFRNCKRLKSVLLPFYLEEIGVGSFEGCVNLERVLCPPSLTKIGDYAFRNCTALEEVRFSYSSSASSLRTIGVDAFEFCHNLSSFDIPDGVHEIGLCAFAFCSSLESVRLPAGMTSIENALFRGCVSLREFVVPKNVSKIGINIVAGCENLTSLRVEEGNAVYYSEGNCVIRREDRALIRGCSVSKIPENVLSIEKYAFHDCPGLRQLVVPGSVERFGTSAISSCKDLESITLSEGIKAIGERTNNDRHGFFLASCPSLTEVHIPASVEYIQPAFGGRCENLTSLTVAEGNAVYYSEGNCVIRRADRTVVAGCVASEIPEGVEKIGKLSFYDSSLEKIEIPGSVKEIGQGAFSDCKKLKELTLSEGLEVIGHGAFGACNSLRFVAFPQSLKTIRGNAFYFDLDDNGNATSWGIYILPGSVETIENHAFDLGVIYTTASYNSPDYAPAGWARKTNLALSWFGYCSAVFECEFEYEEGIPYVAALHYVSLVKPEQDPETGDFLICPTANNVYAPLRAGYTFMGWATEEGSDEVVYGVKYVGKKDLAEEEKRYRYKIFYNNQYTPPLPSDITLYAVWQRDE